MAYEKGNFYHEDGKQVVDDVVIKNATMDGATALPSGSTIGGVSVIKLNVVPTTELAAPGTICVSVTTDGTVGVYLQEGTATVPSWSKVTTA